MSSIPCFSSSKLLQVALPPPVSNSEQVSSVSPPAVPLNPVGAGQPQVQPGAQRDNKARSGEGHQASERLSTPAAGNSERRENRRPQIDTDISANTTGHEAGPVYDCAMLDSRKAVLTLFKPIRESAVLIS